MTSGPIPTVAREDVFPEPNLRFGRLPQYSRVGLAAVAFALRDAGMEHWETKRSAVIVASTRAGCLATDIEYYDTVLPEGGGVPSPNLFSSTLPPCFLGEAAIQFGLTGPTLVVNDPAEDALGGVRMALESLSWGECGTMLAGHIDLPAEPDRRFSQKAGREGGGEQVGAWQSAALGEDGIVILDIRGEAPRPG